MQGSTQNFKDPPGCCEPQVPGCWEHCQQTCHIICATSRYKQADIVNTWQSSCPADQIFRNASKHVASYAQQADTSRPTLWTPGKVHALQTKSSTCRMVLERYRKDQCSMCWLPRDWTRQKTDWVICNLDSKACCKSVCWLDKTCCLTCLFPSHCTCLFGFFFHFTTIQHFSLNRNRKIFYQFEALP
jgi:hypothetical protein